MAVKEPLTVLVDLLEVHLVFNPLAHVENVQPLWGDAWQHVMTRDVHDSVRTL